MTARRGISTTSISSMILVTAAPRVTVIGVRAAGITSRLQTLPVRSLFWPKTTRYSVVCTSCKTGVFLRRRAFLIFVSVAKPLGLCNTARYFWNTHCKEDLIYVFPEIKLRGLVPNSYLHSCFSERLNTVKRVDEVVPHRHLVTQDQTTQVSNKFFHIHVENFTINIELFRHFRQTYCLQMSN